MSSDIFTVATSPCSTDVPYSLSLDDRSPLKDLHSKNSRTGSLQLNDGSQPLPPEAQNSLRLAM